MTRAYPTLSAHRWPKSSLDCVPMEAMTATRGSALWAPPFGLLREPMFWAASAAQAGSAVGLVGTFRQAALEVSYDFTLSAMIFAWAAQTAGQSLAALSLTGVPSLLGHRTDARPAPAARRILVYGGLLVVVLSVAASAATTIFYVYANTGARFGDTTLRPAPLLGAAFWASAIVLPPLVALPYAAASFLQREARLGALLTGLSLLNLPFFTIRFWLFPPDPDAYWEPSAALALLGAYGTGVSLPEAPLWVVLGVLLYRAAGKRALARASQARGERNLRAARRLYTEALGRGNLRVVDEVVSEDFRDLGSSARGRLGMERVLADLWASYPDLSVSVENQEAEGDVVRTRVKISGTDRGRGVMWYPPTGRRVRFCAEFADRFEDGLVVEHAGEADTEGLLEQLGHLRDS